jgi:hypothetical protein
MKKAFLNCTGGNRIGDCSGAEFRRSAGGPGSQTWGLSFGFPGGYSAYPTYLNYYPYEYYRHPYIH